MNWLGLLFRREQLESELDKELQYDLDPRAAELTAQGLDPQEAARRVRLEFGGGDQIKEARRDARGTRWIEDFVRDCRDGLRVLRRSPVFTSVALLSLVLGIGANTAIFSLMDRVMLRRMPVRQPEQLVQITRFHQPYGPVVMSYPLFQSLGEGLGSFEGLLARSRLGIRDMTPDANGLRGAIVLKASDYNLEGTVTIAASGVVLRGSGATGSGTAIHLTGAPHRFLGIRGGGVLRAVGNSAAITDAYIPSDVNSFDVDDASAFHIGDVVVVRRPVTEAWAHFMGMDTLVRDGKAQTWIKAGSSIHTDRTIQAIAGKLITLDVPLTDSFDAKYLSPPGATIVKYEFPGRITQVGVENLRVEAPFTDVPITSADFTVLRMDALMVHG